MGQMLLYEIDYIAGNLWCQYGEVVGGDDKYYSYKKTYPILPEIFIDGGEMFQLSNVCAKVSVWGMNNYELLFTKEQLIM